MNDQKPKNTEIYLFTISPYFLLFIFLVAVVGLPWVGWGLYAERVEHPMLGGVGCGVTGCLSLLLIGYLFHLYKARKSKIEINSDGIARTEGNNSSLFLSWDEVRHLSEAPGMQRLVLMDDKGFKKIKIDYQYENFDHIRETIFEEYEKRLKMPSLPVTFGKVSLRLNNGNIFMFLLFMSILLPSFLSDSDPTSKTAVSVIMSFVLIGYPILYFLNERAFIHAVTLDKETLTLKWLFRNVVVEWSQIKEINWIYESNQGGNKFSRIFLKLKDGKVHVLLKFKFMPEIYLTLKKAIEQFDPKLPSTTGTLRGQGCLP